VTEHTDTAVINNYWNTSQNGRKGEGSGWGTHVYLWQIHFDIWQNQYNIVKLNKIKNIDKHIDITIREEKQKQNP